jgi:hypothetical protein
MKGHRVHLSHIERTVAYIKDWYLVGRRRGGWQHIQNMLRSL